MLLKALAVSNYYRISENADILKVSLSTNPCDIQWFQARFLKTQSLGFLARSPTISFYSINADTIWIHSPYSISEPGVKAKSVKKGNSCLPDSPHSVGIYFVTSRILAGDILVFIAVNATGDQKPGMMVSQVSLALNFCRLVGDSCNYHNSSAGAALCAPQEEIDRNFYTD